MVMEPIPVQCLTRQHWMMKTRQMLHSKFVNSAVLTILEGGHKPGILRDFSEHGKLIEFCATAGKNYNKLSTFSTLFKCLCRTAGDLLYCWN